MGMKKDTARIKVDFGASRSINTVKLYFPDDGEGVVPPESYEVQYWTGNEWDAIPSSNRKPDSPTGRRPNTLHFEPLETTKLRAVLNTQPGAATGLTEFEAWSDADIPLPEPNDHGKNLAYNPDSTGYPKVSASHTYQGDSIAEINDMKTPMLDIHRENRWTAYESANASDWVQVSFGSPAKVQRLDLYLWGDGEGVTAPSSYTVEYWTRSGWEKAKTVTQRPITPLAMAHNTVLIEPVQTSRIRVHFNHAGDARTGVAELMVWSEASGP
jgi:hypothetical protein